MTTFAHTDAVVDIARWSISVSEAIQGAERKQPERKTVELFRLSLDPEGNYQLAPRPSFTGAVDAVVHRQTRFNGKHNMELADPEKLEAFFRREESDPYFKWTDAQAWSALLAWAEQVRPSGEEMRQASRYMALLIVVRAGITDGGKLAPYHLDSEGVS